MSNPLFIPVAESLAALKSELKKAPLFAHPRIKMLMEMKKAGEAGVSKRELMDSVGASSQSIHTWRTAYKEHGLGAMLSSGRKGKAGRPSVFTDAEHERIGQKLNDPKNGLRGYKELQGWIEKEFSKKVRYNTVLKYAAGNFGAGIKVARKSHVKKQEGAAEAFKKTSHKK
jgi:transposase